MIPWKKWVTYGVATILGALLGLASASITHGYVLVAILLGAVVAGAIKRTEHMLFTSALVLLYATTPHNVNLVAAAGVALATALICRAMQGFSRPSR